MQKEKVFVSSISFNKAKDVFEKLNQENDFEFIAVNEEEKELAQNIKRQGVRAFIADIYPYKDELYTALPKGGVIARYGVGYDSIDLEKASANDLFVCNTPGVLDNAVAEQTVGLIISLARNLHTSYNTTKQGQWQPQKGIELKGRKVALIGFGRIAQNLCKKLTFGFDMQVTAVDICSQQQLCQKANKTWQQIQRETGVWHFTNSKEEVLKDADFVVLLTAVSPSTKHIVDEQFLKLMKSDAYLINPARGALIDEIALYDALQSGQIAGVALDVFEQEPYQPREGGKDLRTLDNVLLTPHIGSNTIESNTAMATQAAKNIKTILQEGSNACCFIVN